VADYGSNTIRKIVISSGAVTTLAGTAGTSGSTDATGTSARFDTPYGITTDGTNLYVAEYSNHTIRKIVISSGVVTTLAGTAGTSGSTDATGTNATFKLPVGITTDGTNLFVTDKGNHTIRKIVISTGVVTTLAGTAGNSGSGNATGTSAEFDEPFGITTDGTNLYVAERLNASLRKIVISSGVVTSLSSGFNGPIGITTDGTNLYVVGNYKKVWKVVISSGVATLVAGTNFSSENVDGTGTGVKFNNPKGLTTDGTYIYVADSSNHTIRKIE
jgi:hypothetical protein